LTGAAVDALDDAGQANSFCLRIDKIPERLAFEEHTSCVKRQT
jgi:hypothetical protein